MNKTVRRYKQKPWSYWHRKNALRSLLNLSKKHDCHLHMQFDPENLSYNIGLSSIKKFSEEMKKEFLKE